MCALNIGLTSFRGVSILSGVPSLLLGKVAYPSGTSFRNSHYEASHSSRGLRRPRRRGVVEFRSGFVVSGRFAVHPVLAGGAAITPWRWNTSNGWARTCPRNWPRNCRWNWPRRTCPPPPRNRKPPSACKSTSRRRAEFQSFLDKNPGHPRSAEINLDIAQVAIQEGRTQLSRALIEETEQARTAEAVKARTILTSAGERLDAAIKQLDEQVKKLADAKTPADKARQKKLEDDLFHAEFTRALSYFDVATTYLSTEVGERAMRGAQMELARNALLKLANRDDSNPVVWEVRLAGALPKRVGRTEEGDGFAG